MTSRMRRSKPRLICSRTSSAIVDEHRVNVEKRAVLADVQAEAARRERDEAGEERDLRVGSRRRAARRRFPGRRSRCGVTTSHATRIVDTTSSQAKKAGEPDDGGHPARVAGGSGQGAQPREQPVAEREPGHEGRRLGVAGERDPEESQQQVRDERNHGAAPRAAR